MSSEHRQEATHVFSECNEKPLRSFRKGFVFSFTLSKGYFFQQMSLGREQGQAEPFPRERLAGHKRHREYISIPLLEPGPQVRYKGGIPTSLTGTQWALHEEPGTWCPWSAMTVLHQAPLSGQNWSSSLQWGELLVRLLLRRQGLHGKEEVSPAFEKGATTCFYPPREGLHADINTGSHQIHFPHKLHPHFCNLVCIDFLQRTSRWVI